MSYEFEEFHKGEPNWHEQLNDNFNKIKDYEQQQDVHTEEVNNDLQQTKKDIMASYIPDVEIKGRTLTNLLGRAGNPIYCQIDYWGVHRGPSSSNSKLLLTDNNGAYLIQRDKTSTAFMQLPEKGITKQGYYIMIAEGLSMDDDSIASISVYDNATIDVIDREFSTTKSKTYKNLVLKVIKKSSDDTVLKFAIADMSSDGVYTTQGSSKFRYIRLYKITEDEYQALNNMSIDEIATKYPYVDDCKSVVNPFVESKENLLDGLSWFKGGYDFSKNDWYNHPEYTVYNGYICTNKFLINKGTYTLNIEGDCADISLYMHIGGTDINTIKTRSGTFIVTEDNQYCVAVMGKTSGASVESGDIIYDKLLNDEIKVTLVKGNKPKKYDECVNSRIMFETTLHEGEKIWRDNDGKYLKNREHDEADLSVQSPSFISKNDNYHVIKFQNIYFPSKYDIDGTEHHRDILIRYDGTNVPISSTNDIGTPYFNKESFHYGSTNSCLVLTLPNILTGWGSNYTPTTDEIRAFFLGWKMFEADSADGHSNIAPIYNGEGTKGWVKLWCGIAERGDSIEGNTPIVLNEHVFVCPTIINDRGYQPYKLIYKKENPTIEEVKVYGNISITNTSIVNISSGLVLNELVDMTNMYNPIHVSGWKCVLKNRTRDILKTTKNNNRIPFCTIKITDVICGKAQAHYNELSEPLGHCLVDYLINDDDTITSFECGLKKKDNVEDSVEKLRMELTSVYRELSDTKKCLERTEHELSQRSNPNLVINGDFKIWQRGERFEINIEKKDFAVNVYTADRWRVGLVGYNNTSDSITVEKCNDGLKIKSNSILNTEFLKMVQNMEVPRSLWNKEVTYSLDISFQGSNVDDIELIAPYYCDELREIGRTFKIHNGRQVIQHTFTMPPLDMLNLEAFRIGSTQECPIEITVHSVKLELGKFATPFVPRTYTEELLDCQRYYEKMLTLAKISNHDINISKNFVVKKRTNPTMEVYDGYFKEIAANRKNQVNVMGKGSATLTNPIYSVDTDFMVNIYSTAIPKLANGTEITSGDALVLLIADAEIY